MEYWLLAQGVRQAMAQAVAAGATPSLDARADYEARYGSSDGDASRVLTVAGDVAEIRISGVITKAPDLLAMLFGGGNVTWSEVVTALASADADPAVKRAELRIDSPGGSIDGMFEAMAAAEAFSKPLRAVLHNTCASAAYAMASQCGEIVAANRAVRIGSVGIVASFYNDENVIEVTSTEAPDKRPDITTEAGKAVVREELDAIHELMTESIAAGRKSTPEKVNADYGRGATLLADEALKRGMIDAVIGAPALKVVKPVKPTSATTAEQEKVMDLNELKALHPAVYAAAVGVGVSEERDRVSAHLIMGEASGDMATALKAAKEGTGMTASLQASYMAAGMARRDTSNRTEDDAAAAAALNGATTATTADAGADAVAALVEARLGVPVGAKG